MSNLRLLVLDIESAPIRAFVWSLFDNYRISDDCIEEPGYCMCISARWYGEKDTMFRVVRRRSSDKPSLGALKWIHGLMTKADGIISYNGKKYDIPVLNREFLEARLKPPAPAQNIDLYADVVRRKFRFASGKMGYVAKRLGIVKKLPSPGMALWIRCMMGDPKAWSAMERYNRRDVSVTDALYRKLLPWTPTHPNAGLVAFGGRPKQDDPNRPVCPRCGGVKLNRVGSCRTKTAIYQKYQCYQCGYWSRDRKSGLAKDQGKRVLV